MIDLEGEVRRGVIPDSRSPENVEEAVSGFDERRGVSW
jgi:hypothetical protein